VGDNTYLIAFTSELPVNRPESSTITMKMIGTPSGGARNLGAGRCTFRRDLTIFSKPLSHRHIRIYDNRSHLPNDGLGSSAWKSFAIHDLLPEI
jgi:hypothetical protein